MVRATTKQDLIDNVTINFEKLTELINNMTDKELQESFDFSKDEKKKESHWNRDKNLRDIYIHLYEWHQLLFHWVSSNLEGVEKSFLPAPYNWKTYGEMNVEFWKNIKTQPLISLR